MDDFYRRPSTKADWAGSINVRHHRTHAEVDCTVLSGLSLKVELEDMDTGQAVLTGSIGSGVTTVDASKGKFTFEFLAAQMSNVQAKPYWFAGVISGTNSGALVTRQLFRIRVTPIDGIVGS